MKSICLRIMAFVFGLLFYVSSICISQSNIIKGTLINVSNKDITIIAEKTNEKITLHPLQNAKIMRGQIGKTMRNTTLAEFANGDWIVAEIDKNRKSNSIKAYFGVITGNYKSAGKGSIVLADGREIKLNNQVQIVLYDGSKGSIENIEPNSRLTCRINPISNEIWTILASKPVPVKEPVVPAPKSSVKKEEPKNEEPVKPVEKPRNTVNLPAPAKPKVTSITFSAPTPLKSGNIITVDLTGTPGGDATVEIKTLIPATKMIEMSPGVYRVELVVPDGKIVNDVPLIGKISIGDQKSDPVQASRLITVVGNDYAVEAKAPQTQTNYIQSNKNQNSVEIQSSPQKANSAADANKSKNDILVKITKPEDGQILTNVLLIEGTAKPESQVVVKVYYTNNKHGMLKLSGEAVNQVVGVDKSGNFKYGPIPLEGVLATKGLHYNIIANYIGAQKNAASIKVTNKK
ncbi:MAG: hypothetical protein SNJ70_00775 [Armatimonadota bacterium]